MRVNVEVRKFHKYNSNLRIISECSEYSDGRFRIMFCKAKLCAVRMLYFTFYAFFNQQLTLVCYCAMLKTAQTKKVCREMGVYAEGLPPLRYISRYACKGSGARRATGLSFPCGQLFLIGLFLILKAKRETIG
ncbi:MAG: hypothetical protein US35_C0026G0004 [Parcubacteria group bacterium GW2011_GWA2_37_10]|nr:MAG: hypothetical protein US35_C0026G0004 [Parcubacteria group bacterium GW2011_GWA2_37_10]